MNPFTNDPRPDITVDHLHWDVLLRVAYQMDDQEHQPRANLLHGLRCGGASIDVRPNGSWKMVHDAAMAYLEPYQQEQFKKQLQDNVAWYKAVFIKAAQVYQEAEQRAKSA